MLTTISIDWKTRLQSSAYRDYFNEYGSRYHTPEFIQFINSIIEELNPS